MSLVNVRLFLCIEFQHHEDIVTELLSNNWKNKILDCSCSFFRLIFSAKPFVFWQWVYFKKVWSETQCLFVVDVASRRHKFVLCPSIPETRELCIFFAKYFLCLFFLCLFPILSGVVYFKINLGFSFFFFDFIFVPKIFLIAICWSKSELLINVFFFVCRFWLGSINA